VGENPCLRRSDNFVRDELFQFVIITKFPRLVWSRDGSSANQLSRVLFMFTDFDHKTSRFILRGNLGVNLFKFVKLTTVCQNDEFKLINLCLSK
jgi:hypothetical protein